MTNEEIQKTMGIHSRVLTLIHTAALARWESVAHNLRNRFNGFGVAHRIAAQRKTVETVRYFGSCIDTGLKPRCE
jgi:hypothetical protein